MKEYKPDHFKTTFTLVTEFKTRDNMAVEFHNVVVFNKLAEICRRVLTKGSKCTILGRIQTRSWETDGVKQYIKEVIANSCEFMEPKKGSA